MAEESLVGNISSPQRGGQDLTHNIILPVAAMGVIGLVLIVFLIFLAARWQDGNATERSLRIAVSMLDGMHREIARTAVDYGRNLDLSEGLDPEGGQAWFDENLGKPVSETHGYDWIMVVDGDNRALYAMHRGRRVATDFAGAASPAIARLVELSRDRRTDGATPRSGLGKIDDAIHFAAVIALQSETNATRSAPPVLLFARNLSDRSLDELSARSGLSDLRLRLADPGQLSQAIPLISADGEPLGGITWTIDNSGRQVFHKALLMILLSTPGMTVLAWAFVRRARDTVVIAMQREQALHHERERAERYLAIVRNIIVALDRDLRVTLINDRGCAVLGRDRDWIVGRDWIDTAVAKDQRSEVRTALTAMLGEAPSNQERVEYQVVTADGALRTIAWNTTNLNDDFGEVTGVLSSGDDVTEQRRIEAKTRQQESELAHFLRLGTMGEMATGLAHELNQPLAAIRNYAQGSMRRVKRGNVDINELAGALEQVNHQATRAGEIIKRIRGFVQKTTPERTATDINVAINDVTDMVGADVRRLDVALTLQIADELPPVHADLIQIEQVILNLVRNGLDALSDDALEKRQLTIGAELQSDDTMMISIEDSGSGIDPDHIEHLFDPFYTTKSNGLGMGLSISRSIVEAHNGTLWAEAIPNGGTVFRFTLPVASAPANATMGSQDD